MPAPHRACASRSGCEIGGAYEHQGPENKMSGIAGIIRFDGGPADKSMVARMTATMPYRGPDGIAHWSSGQVALGQCMLHTTPESLEAALPLTNEDESLILVMDGRVDNWEDLRRRLRAVGARLRTRSDAELVLRAYEHWGEECPQQIDGDFAIAIWDRRHRRLFCIRDRSGAKPFVYHWNGRCLVFGSEIHAVLSGPDVPRNMNQGVLAETLAADWVSRDETLWQGVTRLIAGHCMTVDERGPRITKYWHPEDLPLIRHANDDDYAEHYREVLFDVVRRLSRSHRPVGFEVSGGLDSSSLFAVAHRLHLDGQMTAPDIRGFTLKFEKGTDAYELDFVHAVAAHLDRTIQEIPPSQMSLAWLKRESVRVATPANLPNGLMHLGIMETLQQGGGRVLLDGDGGDQWLAFGDNDLAECLQLGDWDGLGAVLKNDKADLGAATAAYRLMRHGLYPLLPLSVRKMIRAVVLKGLYGRQADGHWLKPELQTHLKTRKARRVPQRSDLRIGLRERLMSLDGAYPAMASDMMDRLTSSAEIERRSPFRSKTFTEFALGLPLTQLRRPHQNRHIHRKVMTGLLPDVVRQRTSKAEFSVVSEPHTALLSKTSLPALGSASLWIDPQQFSVVQNDAQKDGNDHLQWSSGMLLQLALCVEIHENANKL